MSSIEALGQFFDKAKAFCIQVAQERDDERARNADLEQLLKSVEDERDRERRDRLKLVQEYSDLEDRARRLERDNAVMHSRNETIIDLIKGDGERIADSSHIIPQHLMSPRPAADDDLTKDFEEIGRQLREKPLHPALADERPPMMQSVVDEIAASSEAEPR